MTKKVLLLLALCCMSQAAFPQVRFGLRAGIISPDLNINDQLQFQNGKNQPALFATSIEERQLGFQAGLMVQIELPEVPIMIIPELLFTSVRNEVNVSASVLSSSQATVSRLATEQFSRVDLPVLAALKLGPLRVQAGPVASFVLSENGDVFDAFDELSSEISAAASLEGQEVSNITVGYQAGLGINILNKLALDVLYEGSLSKISDGITIGGVSGTFDQRVEQFVFKAGLLF